VGGHLFGGYLHASRDFLGLLSQLRLSFYPNVDFGFHGGLTRLDPGGAAVRRTTLRVGGDLRWQVAHVAEGSRADVAAGIALGVETADDFKVVSIGPSLVASRMLSVGSSGGIAPYAGLGLLFSSRDAFGVEDSDLSVPLRLGMEARFSAELRVVAELQLFVADRYSDDVGFATGLNLPF
jgi:hypothetical protein